MRLPVDIYVVCEGVNLKFDDSYHVVTNIMGFIRLWITHGSVPTFDIELTIQSTGQRTNTCRGAFEVRQPSVENGNVA